MIIKIKRKLVNGVVIGVIISLSVTTVGIMLLELTVRKYKPQITFTEAVKQSRDMFDNNGYTAFTLRPDFVRNNLSTNSQGYRNKEFTVKKPANTFRILFLGDSYVFSSGVADNKDTLPQYLENVLNVNSDKKIEVINAGFHDGFSPDSYYAFLKNEGIKLDPDMVITGVYLQNDIGDLKGTRWEVQDENKLPLKVVSEWRKVDSRGRLYEGIQPLRYRYSYLKDLHLWILMANWLDSHFPVLRDSTEATRIKEIQNWYFLIDSNCVFLDDCFNKFAEEFEKLKFVLKGIDNLLVKNNIIPVFVYLPSKIQVNIDMNVYLREDQSFRLQNNIMKSFSTDNLKSNFLDLTQEYLKPDSAQYYNYKEYHWNAKGNRKSAEIIAGYIKPLMKNR